MKSGIKYILLSLLAVGIASCVAETEPSDELGTGKTVQFMVQTETGETKATEPGDPILNENRIDRIDVMFYDGETQRFYPTTAMTSFDSNTNKVKIHVPSTAWLLFNNTTSYKMVVLANLNLPRTDLENKTYTQMRQLVSSSNFTGSPHPQTNFLMDGTVNTVLSFNNPVLPTVSLSRAAVKIRASIKYAQATGYTPVSAKVKLMNYIDKTSLTSGLPYSSTIADFKATSYRDLAVPGVTTVTTNPFYTFESDWSLARQKEPYLIVEMIWKNTSTQVEEPYYYKVPFNYLNSPDLSSGLAFKLLRNTIYDIGLNINGLGSKIPEEPRSIQSNFTILNWKDRSILASFIEFHYMVVHELFVKMYNINTRSIGYSSSLPIEIFNIAASCEEYDTSGNKTIRNYTSADPQFPTITVDAANSEIDITSSIPINYVPKTITFSVRTIGSTVITQAVTIIQYPPIYVTALWSTDTSAGSTDGVTSNNPNGAPPTQVNFNLFKITTVVPNDPTFNVGDPRQYSGSTMTTRTDVDGNNIRSPQFVIASQRGITSEYTYSVAQNRCKLYQELPYLRGKWRIPTKAEILLIDKIQDDPNSAVKRLLIGPRYWSAYTYQYYDFAANSFTSGNQNSTAFIRCVTDTWDLP